MKFNKPNCMFVFFLLIFFSNKISAQQKINQFDSRKNKTGYWEELDTNRFDLHKFAGVYLKAGKYSEGKKEGWWKFYYSTKCDSQFLFLENRYHLDSLK